MRGFLFFVLAFFAALSCIPAGVALFNAFFFEEQSLMAFTVHGLVMLASLIWLYMAVRVFAWATEQI